MLTGQMAAALRTKLGITQAALAAYLGCSERTVRRMERGLTIPLPIYQRQLREIARERAAKTQIKTYRINAASMRRYLGPTFGWRKWTWHERGRWLRWKRFYAHAIAEEQAGRARIIFHLARPQRVGDPQPVAAVLDSISDLDLS